jgi:hypothetical protein
VIASLEGAHHGQLISADDSTEIETTQQGDMNIGEWRSLSVG